MAVRRNKRRPQRPRQIALIRKGRARMNSIVEPVRIIPVGMLETNCVLVRVPGSDILYIFDPGAEADRILRAAQTYQDVRQYKVLLTHAHFDHIGGAGEVCRKLNVPCVYLAPQDHPIYLSPDNCMLPYIPASDDLPDVKPFPASDELPGMKILPCPGHSPGGSAFYFPELQTVISGDSLFYQSIGRTDFPGGDGETLLRSVREQLFTLPADTRVIPGHGCETTIGFEKLHNPYFS